MIRHLPRLSALLIAGLAFSVTPLIPGTAGPVGVGQALAGGGHGNGGGHGGSSDSHGSSSDHASSGQMNPGHSKSGQLKANRTVFASTGGGSASHQPHAAVRKYVLENGLRQGDVASLLKSWNSLNRNERAFVNNLDNPSSLPGRQAAYVCSSAEARTALTAFTDAGGSLDTVPTQDDVDAAQAFIDASATLDTASVTVDDVLADPTSFDQDIVDAANLIDQSSFTSTADAQDVVTQFDDYQTYAAAREQADADFLAASSGAFKSYDDTRLASAREAVDDIVARKFSDTSAICDTVASN